MFRPILACTLLFASAATAQPIPLRGSAELHELLDRLNTVGTVLMLAAHPDDENTAVMAYFARGRHLRTVYMSATRGEGGQNLIGSEQGSLLGVIRTHELLAARRIDGGEQAFTSVVDFGFSKTPEEALRVWGADRLLRDMVRVIRTVRPDVIVSRFPPRPGSGGHGHHTAVGWTGPTAYEAAADSSQFPELGLPPWRARRYYHNVPTFNRRMEEAAAQEPGRLRVELGDYDPVLGKAYAELAGESRSMHRSQAMGAQQRKGSVPAFFEYVAGERAERDLLEGIDTSWQRIPGAREAGESLALARERYDPRKPASALPHLLAAHRVLKDLAGPEVEFKRRELARAIELASGIWAEATADRWDAVPGGSLGVTARAMHRGRSAWTWRSTRVEGLIEASIGAEPDLERNLVRERTADLSVPDRACYSQPHWLQEASGQAAGCVQAGSAPGTEPILRAIFEFETPEGQTLALEKPVEYRWVDRSLGERSRPLAVVPAVAVSFARENRIFADSQPVGIAVRLASNAGKLHATVQLEAPAGWAVEPAARDVAFERRGQEKTVQFQLTPPTGPSGGVLRASATLEGRTIRSGMRTIEYDHIPMTAVFPPAEMRVERFDVQVLAKRVGYVMGAGDKVPDALEQLGATVTFLGAEDLASGDLSRFDAIVTGIRALNTRPDLLAARDQVLDYVREGGTLVVQYNTAPFRRGRPPRAGGSLTLAPFPMTPSRLRVTDEFATVSFLAAEHPLLRTPNAISAADFEGWVQERGLYFMSEWDPRYDAVLACHDPGENPLDGGLLYASYGQGAYVFTGYSWFRQLPAGVPGAYRVFANLISAGQAGGSSSGKAAVP